MLKVRYCDRAVSVVLHVSSIINFLPNVRYRGHIFSLTLMKFGQNICLNKISEPFPPLYTHFNTLKRKALGKHYEKKAKLLKMSNLAFLVHLSTK